MIDSERRRRPPKRSQRSRTEMTLCDTFRVPSHLFFNSNEALRPPYNIILDTNFFVNSVRHRIDISSALMDLLLAKCTPVVTDCVIAELEKLSTKNRLALRVAKDPRFKRLACSHSGTYADDCIMSILSEHRIYLVGTGDADLKRRLRRLPGVPLVAVGRGKYYVERLPEAVA
ncbi:unnamed protein product [Clonostachys byssicola]|uniref:PIN domain-containing protein n=1 Tax=Clonostachys byssicola TaxID=160290 RepID=A0A9N9XWE3_9HYPO|nr:unnamed protein product [Clonostachys byssicola]